MTDDDFGAAVVIGLIGAFMVIVVIGVGSTCGDVSDLKKEVCALNYHAAQTASDSLAVQRNSGCPLPSTTKATP